MRWLARTSHRLRSIFRKDAVEQALNEEVRFHLERQIAENIATGMDPAEARHAALREFGGAEQYKEDCRDQRGVARIESLAADLRYALSALRKSSGFAVISILTLALGIGANTAIFSMVNALLLHPYKFRSLDTLVRVWEDRGTETSFDARYLAPGDAEDMRAGTDQFESMATYVDKSFNSTLDGSVQAVLGGRVSANFFDVLGVLPLQGRLFSATEQQPGLDQVVVISHGFWQRRISADPHTLGKTIQLNGRPYTIVGIMPSDFDYPVPVELWIPLALSPAERLDRANLSLEAIARLKPGVKLTQARDSLTGLTLKLQKIYPKTNSNRSANLLPLRRELYEFTLPLFLLLQAASGLVLLLACANLTNLVFARMIGRQRELALRTALGAGRARLAQLFICETIALSAIGGAVAIFVSFWSVNGLRTSIPVSWTKWVPGWDGIRVDSSVLGFTILLAVVVGILFGLVTVLHGSHIDLNKTLKETGAVSVSRTKGRLRSALVVAQVIFALVLLICAGSTIQGFARLANVYAGFQPASVMRFEIALPENAYDDNAKISQFYHRVLHDVSALPGADSTSLITNPPASNVDNDTTAFTIDNRAPLEADELPQADLQIASPMFFATLRIPLISGRIFTDSDAGDAPGVVVISRSTAARYWPNGDAIGHVVKLGPADSNSPSLAIVGTVGDVRQNWWNSVNRPVIYQPFLQAPERAMTLLLRSPHPAAQVSSVRDIVLRIDPQIALRGINTLEQEVAESIAIVRIMGILMSVFGFVALALSVLGVYGILSDNVAQRTREIGVRLALGATPRTLLKLVLGQALKLTTIGLAIALPISVAVGRAMASLIFGVVSLDFSIFVAVALLFLMIALAAAYLPARRATRIDPITALRYD
jgi:putative ABC transport system permease protein